MKTILEASIEHAKSVCGDYINEIYPNSEFTIGEITQSDFQSGVAFAQRWIPIEEEFPPINEKVIVKLKDYDLEDYYIMKYKGDENELAFVTHWRPIDIK